MTAKTRWVYGEELKPSGKGVAAERKGRWVSGDETVIVLIVKQERTQRPVSTCSVQVQQVNQAERARICTYMQGKRRSESDKTQKERRWMEERLNEKLTKEEIRLTTQVDQGLRSPQRADADD